MTEQNEPSGEHGAGLTKQGSGVGRTGGREGGGRERRKKKKEKRRRKKKPIRKEEREGRRGLCG